MYSRQSILRFNETATMPPRTASKITGSSHKGLRTMSAKVAFGEKITPTRRPNGEIKAWGSAKGADALAIVDSLHDRLRETVLRVLRPASRKNITPWLDGVSQEPRPGVQACRAAHAGYVRPDPTPRIGGAHDRDPGGQLRHESRLCRLCEMKM